ncbi:MAG: tyrosine-type recombinase/integrase [Treponema sp.]|nr:tyrosine-type recombinase/integrase [Treponema sp.]
MALPKSPFNIQKRKDSKTFLLTLNNTSGLPEKVCRKWQRRSYQNLPRDLILFSQPKSYQAAQAGAFALINYLKNNLKNERAQKVDIDDITVGEWVKKFTSMETSPRAAINASRNRPYSITTIEGYLYYFNHYIKKDALSALLMDELEEEDILEYTTRLSGRKNYKGLPLVGTRTFAGVIIFLRMAFKEYQKRNKQWVNPFLALSPPKYHNKVRDALTEEEVIKLFMPGVLLDRMEQAVCSAMFLAGLRRAEIFALTPDCLDWDTPKITVKQAWQNFGNRNAVLGPTKGKKERVAPFNDVLQQAIKALWEENGQHQYVFSFENGKTPKSEWFKQRFKIWLKRAGIELNGRKIVPHSSRHSLASMLETGGVPLRQIQEFLGHSDLSTTKIYLHTTDKAIRDIGAQISTAIDG